MNRAIITFIFVILILAIGFILVKSAVILTELLHSLVDLFSISLSFYALKMINITKPNYTYGLHRLEIVTAILNASVMVFASIFALAFSVFFLVYRLYDTDPLVVICASALGAIGISISELKKGEDIGKESIRKHLLTDLADFLIGIIAGVLILFSKIEAIDPISAIIMVFLSLYFSIPLFRDSYYIVMEKSPLDIRCVEEELRKVYPTVHHVHIWTICSHIRAATLHITVPEDLTIKEAEEIRDEVGRVLKEKFNVEHFTVQFETESRKTD